MSRLDTALSELEAALAELSAAIADRPQADNGADSYADMTAAPSQEELQSIKSELAEAIELVRHIQTEAKPSADLPDGSNGGTA